MDKTESGKYSDWTAARNIANQIMVKIEQLGLPYMLDLLTEAKGDCFPVAVLQQCRRTDIRWRVNPIVQQLAREMDVVGFRWQVWNFMLGKREHPRVIEMKNAWNAGGGIVNGRNWEQFWKEMLEERKWVDEPFVQGTAWFLNLDILIVNTSSRSYNMMVSGNMDNQNEANVGPKLIIGFKAESHYQSLIPKKVSESTAGSITERYIINQNRLLERLQPVSLFQDKRFHRLRSYLHGIQQAHDHLEYPKF